MFLYSYICFAFRAGRVFALRSLPGRNLELIKRVKGFFLVWAVVFFSGIVAGASGREPVFGRDFPDPSVLRVDDWFYAYSTNSGGKNVPVLRSRDLRNWEERGDALPEHPKWTKERGVSLPDGRKWGWFIWAPGAARIGDRFVLYYTSRYSEKGRQAISFAESESPEGPFVDTSSEPLVFQEEEGGSIDPEVFRDEDGTLYLLWKSDANAVGRPAGLYIQKLAEDGRSLTGERKRILEMDREWEKPLIENPSLLFHDGIYYLIYSANWWESDRYSVGYATAEKLFGPYTKRGDGPVLQSGGGKIRGPGGAAFFRDVEGKPWIAFHAWTDPKVGYRAGGARALHVARVAFAEGKMIFDFEF